MVAETMWAQLGRTWLGTILPAIGLAILLVAVLVAAPVAVLLPLATKGPVYGSMLVMAAAFLTILAHALFVTLLTDHLITCKFRPQWRAIGAALALAVPITLFAWLDAAGASHGCADGRVISRNVVPMWPWGWIGWLLLSISALPARLLGHGSAAIRPWPDRALMLAPFALIILLTGAPFQRRTMDCTPPFEGGWGLFEGGMVAFPLLALFLFSMAFALAVLSAAFVRQTGQGTEK